MQLWFVVLLLVIQMLLLVKFGIVYFVIQWFSKWVVDMDFFCMKCIESVVDGRNQLMCGDILGWVR